MHRAALLTLALAACGWPEGLPATAIPGAMPGGGTWPDLLADADAPAGGSGDVAVIVALEDYQTLPDRPGAHAVAAAWYRWFRVERGLGPRRIHLLRDADATEKRISRAIESARRARPAALWLIVIGHIGSATPGTYGELRLIDGSMHSLEHVIGRIAYGRHPNAIAVLDGCLAGGPGLSGTATPVPPPFSADRITRAAIRTGQAREWVGPGRARREPSDVAIFSAGLGPGCTATLPGTRFPALSYLALGALRGWADRDRNGNIRALELLRHVAISLRAAVPADGPRPEPSLYGADLLLARRVAEPPPPFTQLRPPGAPAVAEADLAAQPVQFSFDEMAALERGNFTMGCPRRGDPDCEADERPPHRVRLSRFRIDRHEVTQAEYQQCVDGGVCSPVDVSRCFVWTGDSFVRAAPLPAGMIGPDLPVVCVSWYQAEAYCDARGKHLPTEAEWERAAAGTDRRRYPWGDAPPTCERAHFDGCGEHLRPAGRRPAGATPEGVHDLAGNASEWVHDWYDKKLYKNRGLWRGDPRGPDAGKVRAVRGGSYYDAATVLRAAYRYALNPTSGFSTVGFRCAR